MHYVFTDIHGDMKSWNAVKEQFGQPENMLIFLGDACDRLFARIACDKLS